MQRNMDIIREILFHIEKNQKDVTPFEIKIDNYSDYEITYHIELLKEAGLVTLSENFIPDANGINKWVSRLTWKGHEFLEAAKDNKRWDSAKKYLLEKAGSLPFTIFQSILLKMIDGEIKL